MAVNVLALGAHTDDIELGAGGFVSRLIGAGAEVDFLVGSACTVSNPGEDLASEQRESVEVLGVRRISILDLRVRRFPAQRQILLDRYLDVETDYDIVILPAEDDIHQDHWVVHEEGMRAFKRCTILGYEMPWNRIGAPAGTMYVPLHEGHVYKKIEALECFRSQKEKQYMRPHAVSTLLEARGQEIGVRFAERFTITRLIWTPSFLSEEPEDPERP